MKHLSKLSLSAAAIMVLTTACGSKEPLDTITTQGFTDCYAIITDNTTGETTVSQQVMSRLELNWTQETAEIYFSGFVVGGNTYPMVSFSNAEWSSNKLWSYTITEPDGYNITTGQTLTVKNFKYQWSDRMDMPNVYEYSYDPAFFYSFDLSDRYHLVGSRIPFSLWGTTTAAAEGLSPFTGEVNNIVVTPNFKDMTITVLVNGAKFAERMPPLNIQLDNIPLQLVNLGESFTFETDALTPTISGVPYPNYPVSEVKGTLNPENGMELSFVCTVNGMPYTVSTSPTPFGYRTNN